MYFKVLARHTVSHSTECNYLRVEEGVKIEGGAGALLSAAVAVRWVNPALRRYGSVSSILSF